jgi:hypothetical protein
MKVFPYLRLAFLSNQTTFSIKVVIWFIRSVRSKVVVLAFILVTKWRKSNSKFIPRQVLIRLVNFFFGPDGVTVHISAFGLERDGDDDDGKVVVVGKEFYGGSVTGQRLHLSLIHNSAEK